MTTNLNIRYMVVIAFNATFNNISVVNNRSNNHIHVELCIKQLFWVQYALFANSELV